MSEIFDNVNELAVDLASSPWVYLAVLAFVIIDAFFPPIPSESVIVALAAISSGAGDGEPNLVLLAISAAAGALIGDNIAYQLGRLLGVDRFAVMRRPTVAAAVTRARLELDKRAALLILTARYIPVGRVAVNMTAGATGFPFRRFFPLAVIAAITWSTYSVVIGVIAGSWVKDNPLLGAVLAIALAMVIGYLVDRLLSRRRRRLEAAEGAQDTEHPR